MHACMKVSGSPGTGATDSYELPFGPWELNSDPQEVQPAILITELSFQLQNLELNKRNSGRNNERGEK